MKKILALTTLSLIFISCKKEKNTINSADNYSTYEYVTTAGSYWIYDRYQVDSLGNETLLPGQDTITLAGVTTIDGKVYYKYVGTNFWNSIQPHFERDSAGYILDQAGKILYSFHNQAMTANSHADGQYQIANKLGVDQSVTTVFGVKRAMVNYMEISMGDGSQVNACGDFSMKYYKYHVSGIGMVEDETETFAGMANACSKKRRKLSSYYIAP